MLRVVGDLDGDAAPELVVLALDSGITRDYEANDYHGGLLYSLADPRRQGRSPPAGLSRVRVHALAPLHLAFIRNLGPYEDVDVGLFDELDAWLAARGWRDGRTLCGIGHDAPGITPRDKLRFDACATVPERFVGDGRVGYQYFDARTVALISYVGPLHELSQAF